MSAIGPLSSNALGLFRTASSNVLTQSLLLLKKNADQSNPLLDALDKSDPAKAKKIRDGQSALSQTIEKLQSAQKEDSAQRKEAAKQKIERIKAQIQSLRLQASVDPKAAARQAANLSRELANAAREYAGSTADSAAAATALGGGSVAAPASTASVNATVNASQTETSPDTAAAPPAPAVPGEGTPPSSEPTGAAPAQDEAADIKAEVDAKIAAASEKIGASAADQEFAREARRLLNELKNIIKTAKEKIEAEEGNDFNQDIHDSENALREAERYINDIGAGALATTITASVDILV